MQGSQGTGGAVSAQMSSTIFLPINKDGTGGLQAAKGVVGNIIPDVSSIRSLTWFLNSTPVL